MRKSRIYEGDIMILEHFQDAHLEDGRRVCEACLFERISEAIKNTVHPTKADYQDKPVVLNKIFRDEGKYKIYLSDPQTSEIRKIVFGSIGLSNNKATPRKFRVKHNCGDSNDPSAPWSCLR
tara:strand:+ start:6032 stop:6397 length:366 start_codon:yes stop_codon:yes gene_type:complete